MVAHVAVLAIGNELLSGKIRDENVHYLSRELRALGLALTLAMIVPDEEDAIVEAIRYAEARSDLIITSGGVGPTHDDITLSAVAAAFDRELVLDDAISEQIHTHYGDRVNDELLSMARIPRDTEKLQPTPFFLPIFKVETVHVFPGDPIALRLLFDAWKPTLRTTPFALARLELDVDEGEIAPLLRTLEDQHAGLSVGSYPRYDEGAPYRVLVTLESKAPQRVAQVAAELADTIRAQFGTDALLRLRPPEPANTEERGH